MRVLLIKTSSMGDVIHSLPALTDAKKALPDVCFDWVVEENFAEIPTWHPAVNNVIAVAIRRWRKHPLQTWRSGEWQRFKEQLASVDYDLVIDAQGLLKSAWLTRYVSAPVAGFDKYSSREPFASYFYQYKYPVTWGQHAVERVRQLFAQALGYEVPTSMGVYGLDRSVLVEAEVIEPPYVVFLHGTTWVTKHWPEYYWRQLAELMVGTKYRVKLPWGNEAEKARAHRIAEGLDAVDVLPRLSLKGVAQVLANAKACVAVDTGLGHLAAALAVPTITVFGPTNPRLTGTYGEGQVHLIGNYPSCVPCLKKQCCYQPTVEDKQRFDMDKEQPLCFSQTNPEVVFSRLKQIIK